MVPSKVLNYTESMSCWLARKYSAYAALLGGAASHAYRSG